MSTHRWLHDVQKAWQSGLSSHEAICDVWLKTQIGSARRVHTAILSDAKTRAVRLSIAEPPFLTTVRRLRETRARSEELWTVFVAAVYKPRRSSGLSGHARQDHTCPPAERECRVTIGHIDHLDEGRCVHHHVALDQSPLYRRQLTRPSR